ncbi:triose-phosphate isomerase family protein [Cellulomonas sp. C5510]|uniref:triose-phosphate isomerase n=1 Tax=Cellulomonas sp. C5510 TaxID=2871170 RepID=UPI001C9672AD|nr:triose-phosphate isomerase family protein [Cellulomonas sp. C5510]QZN86433.1 triose-phosphate isomerase [Cellulomonas sp. C5510]
MSARTTRPLAAVSLKTYLGQADTLAWLEAVRGVAVTGPAGVDLLVLPVATALPDAARVLGAVGVRVGAQDCSWTPPGAYTGELPAELLAEVGAEVVEIGHAERTGVLGEDAAVTAAKAAAAVRAGLVPLVCVGEDERVSPEAAASRCAAQLDAALRDVPEGPVLVAYEPEWAIGADEPAGPDHVRAVCRRLRTHLDAHRPDHRLLYGGTAGPGVFTRLHPDVDGLFLGRRAHEVAALAEVIEEMARVAGPAPVAP